MVNIGVMGYGVVGSGVVEVIRKNAQSISRKAGKPIVVKKILDIRDFPDSPDRHLMTKNPADIFDDDSISIVVETIGGIGAAYDFTKKALQKGKHVVTSNKELVATHGPEILKMAGDYGLNYLFEGSVGGGIPIIKPLNQCLAANEIISIIGILNGTTNYILTMMRKNGSSFKEALQEAQRNGYAEADPTADIEGHDSCRKIAILSSIAYNEFVDYKNIYTEGIVNISSIDIEYAEQINSVIKLITLSKKVDGGILARVSPAIISKAHPLANVDDVFNAIVVKGNVIGDAMFYGPGAGKLPTASAVVADVIDIVIHAGNISKSIWERKDYNNLVSLNEYETRYYVRIISKNMDEAKSLIKSKFGCVDFINLNRPGLEEQLAFITPQAKEGYLAAKVAELKESDSILEVANVIRVEEEGG